MGDGSFTQLFMEENDPSEPNSYMTHNEYVSLSPLIPQLPINKQRSNVKLSGIRRALEAEYYTSVIEGTDIHNDLVEDESEEDLEKIDATCKVYKEPSIPEFTNINQENKAIIRQWVPWVENYNQQIDKAFYIGQQFSTKEELQAAAKVYSLKSHQEYAVVESSPTVLVLKCKQGNNCPWKLRASIPKGCTHFQVKKYVGPHMCVNPLLSRYHKQLDFTFITSQIMDIVRAQTSFSPAAVQSLIAKEFKYDITYKQAWNGKMRAMKELFGDWKESYKILPRYLNALQQQNPGSVIIWQNHQSFSPNVEIFKRVFWAFDPSIEGFKYCRPVISIDGTHLYGKYKGTLLIAMGCDANNQLFPLAFAVVESENNDS